MQADRHKGMGIDAIYLTNVLDASYPAGVVNNFYNLNAAKGSKEDFDIMMAAYGERGIAVILRFCVDSTTLACGMFKDDQQRTECYPIAADPQDWQDEQGRPLWHRHKGEHYLSYRGKEFPLLDWHSPVLRSRMGKALRHWMEQGVKGFVFAGIDGCMHSQREQCSLSQLNGENMKVVRFLKDVVSERSDCCSLGEFVYAADAQKYNLYATRGLDLLLRGLPRGADLHELEEALLRWQGKFLGFPQMEQSEQGNYRLCRLASIILSADNLLLQDSTCPQDLQSYRDDNFFSVLLGLRKDAVLGIEKVLAEKDFRSFLLKCTQGVYLLGINLADRTERWRGVQADKLELLPVGDSQLSAASISGQDVLLPPVSLALGKLRW